MRKLLLRCDLSLGDIVMLTAAVRDLHHCYPKQFLTDVVTPFPDLWENNPYLTPLSKEDASVEHIDCSYPLIDRCNETPYHCLHGFIEFLNDHLGLAIKPSAFKGDIHLSNLEKAWCSQVHELTGQDTPFWIVAAGGKHDVTIKWWESKRYQAVVDHFRGEIQFVQIGDQGHHHPKLNGAIDLRGKTNLRQLLRLVYHAQGVLCSVTGLMHLSAAVETKQGRSASRPCVVIAGGREPAHWEAYPDHQFLHTNGALPCCIKGGCWKDRTMRLRDGDKRDGPDHLCIDVVEKLPRCMAMITPAHVIDRVKMYFEGGAFRFLSPTQYVGAKRGVRGTFKNPYDQQSLSLQSAGMACEHFIEAIAPYPERFAGRGIVICGGGVKYFTNAWVCINALRRVGCRLPIQVWFLGSKEMDERMKFLLEGLGVECIDACKVRQQHPARRLQGWELKPYAILHSKFREVLLLDADNVPVLDPEFLFDTPQFLATGAIFWPDYERGHGDQQGAIWKSCGIARPKEPEFETGQILVDKQRCWRALCLTMWFNENSDFYYRYLHGDKETFHLAFRKLKKSYALVETPIHSLCATMCQHDFAGRRIFQHRNLDKWDLFPHNRKIKDFWFESECREYVAQLRQRWDGGLARHGKTNFKKLTCSRPKANRLSIAAVMTSCAERGDLRAQTIANLRQTDWGEWPLHIQIDGSEGTSCHERQIRCAQAALQKGLAQGTDYILLLEDDLDFNRHISHNLRQWTPVKSGAVTFAGLYNHQARELAFDLKNNARIIDPYYLFGSQAFLFSRNFVTTLLRRWPKLEGDLIARLYQLNGRQRHPVYYHAPSLVQHIGTASIRGSTFHQAGDFDSDWRV